MGWRSPNEQWYVVETEEVTDTGGSSVLGLENLNPQIQKFEVYHAHDKVKILEPMGDTDISNFQANLFWNSEI